MSSANYIGLDVHQATTVAAVLDGSGKLVMEAIVETKAATLLQFIRGISGELHVTLEEGTCAAWLHDLLLPHVNRVIVCDPRKNALLVLSARAWSLLAFGFLGGFGWEYHRLTQATLR